MSRQPDLSFNALVEVTGATVASERGALNAALRQIREQADLPDEELATEIVHRAGVYRQMWPGISLTPSALSKHWERVPLEAPKPTRVTNAPIRPSECATCGGDRLVLVQTRPSKNGRSPYEEYAPCPSCAPGTDVGFWRADGSRFRPLDPAAVRQKMEG